MVRKPNPRKLNRSAFSFAISTAISAWDINWLFVRKSAYALISKIFSSSRQEQVSVLYQNINIVEPRLIQPYEHVIKNFIREIKLQSAEMENLAIAVKR